MDLILSGVVVGVAGTLAMDGLNDLFARTGMISKIDVGSIGRMSAGWARGRFQYESPHEMRPLLHEKPLGVATHYAIGIALALVFLIVWDLLARGPASPLGALLFGLATTVASWFFVYPSMGLGACGLRSPDRMKNILSSLANHLFFGLGMAIGVLFV
jgi:hypothetical protein